MKNNKTNKFLLILLLWTVSLISCSDKFCYKSNKGLIEQCQEDKNFCNFKFYKVFDDFDWDNLYVIDSWITPKEIKENTGLDCNCEMVLDGKCIVLFSNNQDVVRKYISSCLNYNFIKMKNQGIVKISKQDVLKVEKKMINNNIVYNFYKKLPKE